MVLVRYGYEYEAVRKKLISRCPARDNPARYRSRCRMGVADKKEHQQSAPDWPPTTLSGGRPTRTCSQGCAHSTQNWKFDAYAAIKGKIELWLRAAGSARPDQTQTTRA
eukprot:scaffold131963_cov45-Prasinocladus_malaysianus.AAC.1